MAIPAPLKCARCGYDLTGLPILGRCPECGDPYNLGTGMGALDVRMDAIRRGEWLVKRFRTLGLAGGAALCLALGAAFHRFNGKSFWVGLFFAAVLALAAFTSWVYEKD